MFLLNIIIIVIIFIGACRGTLTEKELVVESNIVIKYYYRPSSASSAASSKSIILLHGAKYSKETWVKTNTISALAQQHINVYALDIPTKKVDDSVLKDIIEKLGLEKPIILSPSLSGKYSIHLLTHYPHLVGAYIAVAPVIPTIDITSLQSLNIKSLFIYGDKDIEGIKRSKLLMTYLKGSKEYQITGNHACYLDDPEGFNQQIINFIRQ